MSPLLSILMPVKNTEMYLPACLDSIVAQSIPNWELIAINDHSTDSSKNILLNYAQHDQRIKIFDNIDKGIIAALRLAFQKSKGTLITRMDSDDRMSLDKLASMQHSLLAKGKQHIAIGQVQYFSESGIGDGYQRYENWLNSLTSTGTNYQERYKECAIPSPCWMVYREDLEACDAFRPDRYPEDYDLFFRFFQYGLTIIPSNKILHYWRDYPERTSRNDANYADNRFLSMKMAYFLQLDHQKDRPLVVWGAGKKGKWIAQFLTKKNIQFHWICNNPNKIGHNIYGHILKGESYLDQLTQAHYIITVANVEAQAEIVKRLTKEGQLGKDFFVFC